MAEAKTIVIVDYGMGNTMSVKNSLQALGAEVQISREAAAIESASHVILPGVGAFGDGMKHLKEYGLVEILKHTVYELKKPFLGICLGMQMLSTYGEENGHHEGLGFVSGTTRRFSVDEQQFRVPHIGWNDVEIVRPNALFANVHQPIYYFDHGYHLVPDDNNVVIAVTDHGERFAAGIQLGNIFGVQFHPEKSQQAGMTLLGNFLEM